ncbi:MAGa3780 family membrane protein [Mycoplasmopsis columbina]|uniref:MAGa3780 family membrane protein n=1 Tax=Mycoplasmopsis columbina TaxID=114881 RepID=UPI00068DBB0A|nr:hypothetical protein [Mycoplasmopsis columbina]VEU76920.1 Uncharacterised protein [Mycoplasmopsis columbina]
MIKQQIKKSTFQNWNKNRRITLYLGICYILLMFAVTIWSWHIQKNEYLIKLTNLSKEEINFLYSHNLVASPLALFWKVTLTFTWVSNFAMGLSMILFAIYPNDWKTQRAMHLTTSYVTITFLVFWGLIFVPSILKDRIDVEHLISTSIVHFVTPIMGIVAFVLNRKRIKTTKWTILLAMIPLTAYYFFALIVFLIGKDLTTPFNHLKSDSNFDAYIDLSIYPFANFLKPLFYKGGNLGVIVFLDIFVLLALCSIAIFFAWFWAKICKIQKDTVTKPWAVN